MFGTAYDTIICDTPRPHVARITLNRERVMNAYSWRMTQELQAAIAAYRDDDDLRALVITGGGQRAFCTGGDVSGTGGDADHSRRVRTAPMGHGREMRDGMQAVLARLRGGRRPGAGARLRLPLRRPHRADGRHLRPLRPAARRGRRLALPARDG